MAALVFILPLPSQPSLGCRSCPCPAWEPIQRPSSGHAATACSGTPHPHHRPARSASPLHLATFSPISMVILYVDSSFRMCKPPTQNPKSLDGPRSCYLRLSRLTSIMMGHLASSRGSLWQCKLSRLTELKVMGKSGIFPDQLSPTSGG
ncbi:unnamed protein product [Miscanthus lutarioriparius]|uniref:Uncharacterized protein n=1 Tax=Miscanthus lutarioriparius TaxID=422564 RepID=A0A811PCA3_9POAL|nr:unnamed protein product [Miscanthus lutarioriparius]